MSGLDDLEERLKDAEDNLANNVGAGVYKIGLQIEGDAREKYIPVDTGFLQNSLYVSPPKQRGGSITVTVGAGALYAAAVHELNTPFLKMALEAIQDQIADIMKAVVQSAIDKDQVIDPDIEKPKTASEGRANARSSTGGGG